ncbi:probable acylphosphatase [Crocosphaera subtropica ATCC 51142]|uniref:acylphosphatase n=1 Tax=Crocosphaera subtropica (strain ATCC 51142 / BH68) TaxID=43989 RepID=B1WRR7_CROS5|nr:acylphosphatase [Crocosphaera subtropica]ACB53508.1 probable acylphosphatase [Crocosphaera subtropica ATCC 51142]
MTNPQTICVHVFISGKVQGVGYRYSTVQEAEKLGIRGWVRNLLDGRVEAMFEGTELLIEQMLQWCHQGPKTAKVTDVTVETTEIQLYRGFEVRETA